ncbi:hypothetical protein LPW36_04770 [Jinshanibacter sp. LJY008]|uniref:Uncharacterized protein n=1 Tax=Limnobaculum eriocheiris TaxID=2897391 RepID=A0A9X1SJB3_9GAMM|nr:hypothetical protein [Limnobaculum eriocheiris]MCD1125343.1 hypothetical protein [Limnobaculum eriocheiris]
MRNNELIKAQVKRMAKAIYQYEVSKGNSLVNVPTGKDKFVCMDIGDGGLPELVYSYLIEPIYQEAELASESWVAVAMRMISLSLNGGSLSDFGVSLWGDMLNDISATLIQGDIHA